MPAGAPEREIGAASPSSGRSSVKHRVIDSCGRLPEVGLDRARSTRASPTSPARRRRGRCTRRSSARSRAGSAGTRSSDHRPRLELAVSRLRPDPCAVSLSAPAFGRSRTANKFRESTRPRHRHRARAARSHSDGSEWSSPCPRTRAIARCPDRAGVARRPFGLARTCSARCLPHGRTDHRHGRSRRALPVRSAPHRARRNRGGRPSPGGLRAFEAVRSETRFVRDPPGALAADESDGRPARG